MVDDDPKGTGPFILASIEMSLTDQIALKTVGLDNWYNYELNRETGEVYHYIWEDETWSGFSQLGDEFVKNGARLKTISSKPDNENLKKLNVYIIVDPDTTSENPNPNYILADEVKLISRWVKKGGALVLMANNGSNCEFTHFNRLAETFGFHFNPVTLNPVDNNNWNMGAETNLADHPIFKEVDKVFIKEAASITLSNRDVKEVLMDTNNVMIAETRFGKGYVLAVGDPWLYNEYFDHNRLPCEFENSKAAKNLCEYLLKQVKNNN